MGYTDDISGWNNGDQIQLYMWNSWADGCVRNFRILGDMYPFGIAEPVTSNITTTNF